MKMWMCAVSVLALGACAAHEQEPVGNAAMDASELVALYADIAVVGTADQTARVVGTRDRFDIDGELTNPFGGNPARVHGDGGIDGAVGELAVDVELDNWGDHFWDVAMTGTLHLEETSTFVAAGDELPDAVETHIAGTLVADGDSYVLDVHRCSRRATSTWGWTGVVNGVAQSDETPGFDATECSE